MRETLADARRAVSDDGSAGARRPRRKLRLCWAALGALALAACDSMIPAEEDPNPIPESASRGVQYDNIGKATGEGGLFNLFGSGKKDVPAGPSIGVNAYIWRATLDTISFMPLASADPMGGVIITDWYTPPETPRERFKMNLYILGLELRADAIRVSVFRQSRDGEGWVSAKVHPETATNLENQILTRARQLRLAARAEAQ